MSNIDWKQVKIDCAKTAMHALITKSELGSEVNTNNFPDIMESVSALSVQAAEAMVKELQKDIDWETEYGK